MKKILIVEDEKPMARALELKLNSSGFEAKAVYDGAEALQALQKSKYDLMLLDLVMPNVDGFEVLEEIKKKNIKVKVLVSSNLGQEEDKKKAMELGAKGYFIKADTPIADVVKKVEETLK